jgi:hypothetical protein
MAAHARGLNLITAPSPNSSWSSLLSRETLFPEAVIRLGIRRLSGSR